jgi:hypothetical protein
MVSEEFFKYRDEEYCKNATHNMTCLIHFGSGLTQGGVTPW